MLLKGSNWYYIQPQSNFEKILIKKNIFVKFKKQVDKS